MKVTLEIKREQVEKVLDVLTEYVIHKDGHNFPFSVDSTEKFTDIFKDGR